MTPDEHREWASIFQDLAEREFEEGRALSGSEMAWGAAVHAVKVVTEQRNIPTPSHAAIREAIMHLDAEYPTLRLHSGFGNAENLHRNMYRGHLNQSQVRNSWNLTKRFISEILSLTP